PTPERGKSSMYHPHASPSAAGCRAKSRNSAAQASIVGSGPLMPSPSALHGSLGKLNPGTRRLILVAKNRSAQFLDDLDCFDRVRRRGVLAVTNGHVLNSVCCLVKPIRNGGGGHGITGAQSVQDAH